MKRILTLVILFLPQLLLAQRVVVLHVDQLPELGFSISKQDTTINERESVVLGSDLSVFGGSGEYQYHWAPVATLNDSTVVNPVATPSDSTNYVLTVTDQSGCSFSIDYQVNVKSSTVGFDWKPDHSGLHVLLFPNPNDGIFRLEITGSPAEKINLLVSDNFGKVIKKQIIRNFGGSHTEVLQLHLVSGVYILHIDNGQESLSRQFVIYQP